MCVWFNAELDLLQDDSKTPPNSTNLLAIYRLRVKRSKNKKRLNFLPQTTIRPVSGSQTERNDCWTEEEMEISHLTLSSAAPSDYFPTRWSSESFWLFAYVLHVLWDSREQQLTGDMWQCPCIPWQDTLHVSESERSEGWLGWRVGGLEGWQTGGGWTAVNGPMWSTRCTQDFQEAWC